MPSCRVCYNVSGFNATVILFYHFPLVFWHFAFMVLMSFKSFLDRLYIDCHGYGIYVLMIRDFHDRNWDCILHLLLGGKCFALLGRSIGAEIWDIKIRVTFHDYMLAWLLWLEVEDF